MKITYETPWVDADSGLTVTAVELERVRFPHDGLTMEGEFRLFNGDEIVIQSTRSLPVTDPALLVTALNTLANSVKSACETRS